VLYSVTRVTFCPSRYLLFKCYQCVLVCPFDIPGLARRHTDIQATSVYHDACLYCTTLFSLIDYGARPRRIRESDLSALQIVRRVESLEEGVAKDKV
jgi:hypothetical protein